MVGLPRPQDLQDTFWGPLDKERQMRNTEPIENLDFLPYIEYYMQQWNAIATTLDRRSLFPEGFVDETLRTLALLFPQSEYRTARLGRNEKKAWFRSLCLSSRPCIIDPRVTLCGSLRAEDRQIERFAFWRDRLIILKQTYDDATPKTLSQWWHDRRNGERWYTFWVAMLVLFVTSTLGVLQCVEGGLQVYKAYYPTSH
ncbi:hypothetical protein Hte_009467 [Hypoxylon texense]